MPVLMAFVLAAGLATAGNPKLPQRRPLRRARTLNKTKRSKQQFELNLRNPKSVKDGFSIRVQGGIAYWSGSTNVVQHKGSAIRMAKSAGAKAVENHITVSDAAKQSAAANLEQGRRRAQVKRSEPGRSSEINPLPVAMPAASPRSNPLA
jgi:hypothetical protein